MLDQYYILVIKFIVIYLFKIDQTESGRSPYISQKKWKKEMSEKIKSCPSVISILIWESNIEHIDNNERYILLIPIRWGSEQV